MPALHDCPAPAKLNLFLHVTGRRPDGYHALQTAFQLIDRADRLDFETRDDGQIRRVTDVPGVPEETDLIVRAARLLQQYMVQAGRTTPLPGADIRIRKILPMGGGLGGGSSDAATTLIALNHLWNAGLNRQTLMTLGLTLGADVPFFLFGRNAFAEGVGEALTAVPMADACFLVVEPGISIPTATIFRSPQLTRNSNLVRIADFSGALAEGKLFGKNDLQNVACSLHPEVAEALKWLGQYGPARMTGSGSCVFCRARSTADADRAVAAAPTGWKVWKASSMTKHPLAYLLRD